MKATSTLLTALSLSALLIACGESPKQAATPSSSTSAAAPQTLGITDKVVGTGATATAGKMALVHYTGWLFDPAAPEQKGQKFDSSRDRGQPFGFPLGGGRVIQGWDQGVAGMKVGGQRTLVIPAELGYGARGAGGVIPPNATLIFDVELVDVK